MRRFGILAAVVLAAACPPAAMGEPSRNDAPSGTTVRNRPVTLVFLRPLFESGDASTLHAAQDVLDQAATRLNDEPGIAVVDRTQLDRVLRERLIDGKPVGPVLSYDAMVRFVAEGSPLLPDMRVQVLDLSSGNVLAERAIPWGPEPHPDAVQAVVEACRAGAEAVRADDGNVLSVRHLGVQSPEGVARLEARARHLDRLFEQVLAQSRRVRLVQHLEAMTAREESLLLLMGLSRLPGGRQFQPQADGLLEARVSERDAVGKTFEETTVEIRFRLSTTAGDAETWETVAGPFAQWDALAREACERLARRLGEADSAAVGDWAAEMLRRRRQAEAEMPPVQWGVSSEAAPTLEQAARAAKIDPTYEPAAFWIAECLQFKRDPAERERHLPEVLSYLRRFKTNTPHRRRMIGWAYYGIHALDKEAKKGGVTPQMLRRIEAAREIVEIGLAGPPEEYEGAVIPCGLCVPVIDRLMAEAGVALESRRCWLDHCLEQADRMTQRLTGTRSLDRLQRDKALWSLLHVRVHAFGFAAEEGDVDRARRLLGDLRDLGAAFYERMAASMWLLRDQVEPLRKAVAKTGDKRLLGEFEALFGPLTAVLQPMDVRWVEPHLYPPTSKPPRVPVTCCAIGDTRPVAADAGRVFAVTAKTLECIPVDAEGRPKGKARLCEPPPNMGRDCLFTGAAAMVDGRLFLGTTRAGLLAYDVAKGTWQRFDAGAGAPCWSVDGVHPLNETTLFCTGGDQPVEPGTWFTFDTRRDQFTLLRRGRPEKREFLYKPHHVWLAGGRLTGIGPHTLISDLLGTPREDPYWPRVTPFGWPTLQDWCGMFRPCMAEVGGRRFVLSQLGLHEIDDGARVLRNWWNPTFLWIEQPKLPPSLGGDRFFRVPPTLPIDGTKTQEVYRWLTHGASHLILIRDESILCYDPEADTWYGPVPTAGGRNTRFLLPAPHGFWLGDGLDLSYVEVADLLAAARKAGRVVTSPEVMPRQRRRMEEVGPLEAAMFEFESRNFPRAQQWLDTFLATHPEHPEALLLMAYLHDLWAWNKPETASRYYRRLAAIEDNPRAACTGLCGELALRYALGQWERVIATGEEIQRRFPGLDWEPQGTPAVAWALQHARKHLRRKGGADQQAERSANEVGEPESN